MSEPSSTTIFAQTPAFVLCLWSRPFGVGCSLNSGVRRYGKTFDGRDFIAFRTPNDTGTQESYSFVTSQGHALQSCNNYRAMALASRRPPNRTDTENPDHVTSLGVL